MKTIAQQIKWDFNTNGNLEIKNKNGSYIYHENSNGYWVKLEYDSKGNQIYYENSDGYWRSYFENSNGYWVKREYDSKGILIYYENSNGYWEKCEYDSQGNEIYFENSNGAIWDNRPKPCENKVVEIDGIKYKLVKV